ncbi:MAG TPA: hypothetical protein PKC24_00740 [Cyclobacteriaceae bacterium]|nr:hypothetical protein [Cyclobacteriaceae bacterium]
MLIFRFSLIAIAYFLGGSVHTFAQERSKSVFFGVNTFLSGYSKSNYIDYQSELSGNRDIKRTSFNYLVIPQIGIRKDKTLVGFAAGIQRERRSEFENIDHSLILPFSYVNQARETRRALIARLFLNREISIANRLNFFAEANLDFASVKDIEDYTYGIYDTAGQEVQSGEGTTDNSARYLSVSAVLGLRYYVSKNFDLELNYGRAGYQSGQFTKHEGSIAGPFLDFGVNSLSLGLKYYLNQ